MYTHFLRTCFCFQVCICLKIQLGYDSNMSQRQFLILKLSVPCIFFFFLLLTNKCTMLDVNTLLSLLHSYMLYCVSNIFRKSPCILKLLNNFVLISCCFIPLPHQRDFPASYTIIISDQNYGIISMVKKKAN
jgi:hypothetical protein